MARTKTNYNEADVLINDQGTIVLFTPKTAQARRWTDDSVQLEPWQWLGRSFAVDHRYAADLIDGYTEAGFIVGIG